MTWNTEVHKHALTVAGDESSLAELVNNASEWKNAVGHYIQKMDDEALD